MGWLVAVLPQAASDHYAEQSRLTLATLLATRRAWTGMGDDFEESWRTVGPRVLTVSLAAQLAAARSANPYLDRVLPELAIDPDAVAQVAPRAFVGVAGDGRSVESLLYGAVTATKAATAMGAPSSVALQQGGRWLDMAVHTLVADTSRGAVSAGMTARPAVTGWVRMLQLPACGRCAILAGRFYRWSSGFARHPRCLPAGVVVSGPAVDAATRRRYQGELVVITTASGERLPITGNHPVLTDRGWLPAHLVEEGSHVIRSTRGQGAGALVVPDEDQVPSRVEDLWRPDGMVTLRQVPTAAEDFHGDGGYGEVDVVLADRLLGHRSQAAMQELSHQEELSGRVAQASLLALLRSSDEVFESLLRSTDSGMSAGRLQEALLGRLAAGAHLAGPGHATDLDAGVHQALAHGSPADAVAAAEAVLALAGGVCHREVVDRKDPLPPRWDPPAGPLTMQSRAAYADLGKDLRLRLTGQVALDRVIEVSRVDWSGHVYNLTSTEGWYSANGLIVSNCDCRHIPATESVAGDLTTDPRRAYESGQVRGLTAAQTRALDDGADMGRVVNSRRGMDTARSTTTREAAGRQQRLTPEGIYAAASDDRAAAVRMLRQYGYLTG